MLPFKFLPSDRRPIAKIDTSTMLEEFQAKGGKVRTFKRGDSGSWDGKIIFLTSHGYVLKPHNGLTFKIRAPGEKTLRTINKTNLDTLIDEIRVSKVMEPMVRRAMA